MNTKHAILIRNRISLSLVICMIALLGACTNAVTDSEEDESFTGKEGTIVLNNSGSNAYVVTDVMGEGITAETGNNNVDITLEVNGRYTFINEGGASSHPLNFRDGGGNKLLGQGSGEGSYDENDSVDVVRSGNEITFTLTDALADEIVDYICAFHPTMSGNIDVSN